MTRRASWFGDERGSSLLAVIGVMAVFAVMSITVIGTTMSALSATTSTRAAVQAQAAAEAGIAAAVADLASDVCGHTAVSSDINPIFTATVTYLDENEDTAADCAGADKIQIESIGSAANRRAAAGSTPNSAEVVAVYEVDTLSATFAGPPAVIYSGGEVAFNKSPLFASGILPDIQIRDKGFTCQFKTINANIVVADDEGTVKIDSECAVMGTVSAHTIEVTGGGSLESEDPSIETPATVAHWVNLDYPDGLTPENIIDTWPDFLPVVMGPATNHKCMSDGVQDLIAENLHQAIVIDARACAGGLVLQGDSTGNGMEQGVGNGRADWDLHDDVVILARSFEAKNLFIDSDSDSDSDSGSGSGSGSDVNLWLITQQDSGESTCAGDADGSSFAATTIGDSVRALIYTPCAVELASATAWRGQIYAGQVHVDESELTYDAVGSAGLGPALWGDQTTVAGESTTRLGDRVSIRDVD
jgi:hypothetical protein